MRSTATPRVRLFCFPYAGGGASIYRRWGPLVPDGVELCAVQLPGREERLAETPFRRLSDLIPVLADRLRPLCDRPFAWFGHSMGALIAFELARAARRAGDVAPLHLFASGRRAPHLPARTPPLHALDERAFVTALGNLAGTPKAVLENQELMDLLAPVLRADFEVCETYEYRPEPPIDVPVTVLGGAADPETTAVELEGWASHTRAFRGVRTLAGNHFFVVDEAAAVMTVVADEVRQYARPVA